VENDSVNTIGGRIKAIRLHFLLKPNKFAQYLKITRNYINQLEKGTKSPSELFIRALCLTFKVNELWLLSGEGEMFDKPEMAAEDLSPYGRQPGLMELKNKLDVIYNEADLEARAKVMGMITAVHDEIMRMKETARHGEDSSFQEKKGEQKSA
jgi:transcriptional regulator with XRE-family HTH domain